MRKPQRRTRTPYTKVEYAPEAPPYKVSTRKLNRQLRCIPLRDRRDQVLVEGPVGAVGGSHPQ